MSTKKKKGFYHAFSHGVLILAAAVCLLPFILMFASSISSNDSILKQGYSLWVRDFDVSAYRYLFERSSSILNSMAVSVLVTAVGTSASLTITALLAYPLSRRDLPLRKLFSFLVVFTLLFNGGLVPTYLVYTQIFNIKDSVFALLVPNLLLSGFNVMIMRTFFANTIPAAVLEAATIDGAGEGRILWRIVLPLSLPILATVGLTQAMLYWNDWFNPMIYINKSSLLGLKAVLNQMINNINYLSSMSGSASMSAQTAIPGTTVRMAMAFIGILPFVAIYPFVSKYFVKGIAIGAVKE